MDRGPWIVDRGLGGVDRGSWIVDRGLGGVDRGSWIVDRGSWTVFEAAHYPKLPLWLQPTPEVAGRELPLHLLRLLR